MRKPKRQTIPDKLENLEVLQAQLKEYLPRLAIARRAYASSGSAFDRKELSHLEKHVTKIGLQFSRATDKLQKQLGISDEDLKALSKPREAGDAIDRRPRRQLISSKVDVTGFYDEYLAAGIDLILRLLPRETRKTLPTHCGIDSVLEGEIPLSLTKGLRPESEFPTMHRLLQSVVVAQDYLAKKSSFDHFAGATLVPQLAQLANRFNVLRTVGGNLLERLEGLHKGAGLQFDSRLYELLVAAACAERGREVEFIPETTEKSPDLRCHDPYPLVIECKKKRALTDYEIKEESCMRNLFLELEQEAKRRGLSGRFDIRLLVEASKMPIGDIVAALIRQRLAVDPRRELTYPWGAAGYHPLPSRIAIGNSSRAYSPDLLQTLFNWSADLPEFDGIVCRMSCDSPSEVSLVTNPIALTWTNETSIAVKKRAWGPLDVFGDAMSQIPGGEFGIVYVAYIEGARESIADKRTNGLQKRIEDWEHSAKIRIPANFFGRLYPRALGAGIPDLIESTMRFYSTHSGNVELFEYFPTLIYTNAADGAVGH